MGSSSDSGHLADAASVFGLVRKDFMRSAGSQTLQDLSSRQLGYCLASVLPQLTSTRVMELGGELDTGLNINVVMAHMCLQASVKPSCHFLCCSHGAILTLCEAKESLHADRAARARKTKDKVEEADAHFQAWIQ